ncbi:hypothetical protein [Pseudorhodoplanes sp.]|uniref:hypothetical protein n=1 Tax=Pseudorhodoplanes sp. TaxID=1934341 RepID=UPI003D13CDCD
MSRRAHDPDPGQRRQVEAMAAYGIPADDIARVVGIDAKTLRKHYREELDLGSVKANAQVAGFLFNSARNGNVTAQIFWLKTRARWKETPSEHLHQAAIAHCDVRELTTDTLNRILQGVAVDWSDPGIYVHSARPRRGPPALPHRRTEER